MNTQTVPAHGAAPTLRQQGNAFWRGRAPRERLALSIGAAALALLAIWSVAVEPAWTTLRAAPAQLDRLDRQLQQIEATAAEVKALRGVAPVSSTQAVAALKGATERLGSHARLMTQGERATLTLTGVDADALRGWLVEARSAARARPIEASLSRVGDGYSGTLVLILGGAQ